MLFESWSAIGRIIVMAVILYPSLIFILRISGKRTLSKMNMFDLVVTVAIGSTVATILLSDKVTFVEGVSALFMLVFLQFMVTWLEVRSVTFTSLVKGEPSLLLYGGNFLDEALKKERVKKEEIRQAIRAQGISSLEEVQAVVLETDGSFSVIKADGKQEENALNNVKGMGILNEK